MTLKLYSFQQPVTETLADPTFPSVLRTWQGESLALPETGTHFGYVYQGEADLVRTGSAPYRLHGGMYFCLPGGGRIDGTSSAGLVITRLDYHGMFSLGGPVEPTGRLAYIDGGTNSLLIPPLMLGDPCLNAMYFPPDIDQTMHTHPSYRIGVIIAGKAEFATPQSVMPVATGHVFLIPAHSPHKFRTHSDQLIAVMFHPDSGTGYSHRDNPMLQRTWVDGVSAAELPQIQTPIRTRFDGPSRSQ